MNKKLEEFIKELTEYIIKGEEKIKEKYQTEKIPKQDEKTADINRVYKQFRKIEKDNYWKMKYSEIFYRQGKYMENYNLEETVKTNQEHRIAVNGNDTYSGFTFEDFKLYFSWRTKIRKGEFTKIASGFEQLYINELINKIGVKDETEAIEKLIEFWNGYRKYMPQLDKKMPNLIKMIYFWKSVKVPYAKIKEKYPKTILDNTKDIKEIQLGIYKDKIKFLEEISVYKISQSKLIETKYGYLIDECIEKVLKRLQIEFNERNVPLADLLIEQTTTDEYWWNPLHSYTIYGGIKYQNKTMIIDEIEKYECRYGALTRTMPEPSRKFRHTVGYILKTMECYIREYLGYRKLKLPEKSELAKDTYEYGFTNRERAILVKIYKLNLQEIIQKETDEYLKSKKIPKLAFKNKKQTYEENEEKVEIVFNQEQFDKIREKSEEIQKKLIVEEEPIEEVESKTIKEEPIKENSEEESIEFTIEKTENATENTFKTFVENLTEMERKIVQIILNGQDVENKILEIAKTQNEMPEVIISNINDKALETIGDTIIEADMSSIYEDYENEIREVL